MNYDAVIATPWCRLAIVCRDDRLLTLSFVDERVPLLAPVAGRFEAEVARQLACYAVDARHVFTLPLAVEGSAFQRRVWSAIARIPLGETRRYADLAQEIGSVARAVGGACGRNPHPIVVPCHRVVAAAGPGGFNRGREPVMLDIKGRLLRHEQPR